MKKKYFKDKFRHDFFRKMLLLYLSVAFSSYFMTGYSQTIYANAVVSELNVQSSANSTDANPATYSELESGSGIIIGIGSYTSHIELSFPTVVPANQTSFVRIETQDNILSSLVGGTLGNLLSGITGVALVGNQEFTIQVKNGSSVVLSGNSTNPISFSGERLKVVLDQNGHTYLAITPNQPYQSIRITNFVGSLVGLGGKKQMKVWDPYYVVQGTNCDRPVFTSYDTQGISLELLNLGGGVSNLERIIDGSLPSHSTLSLGVVSVASNITQRVYFAGVSSPTDVFAIHLGIDHALLAITLGQGIRIRSQNGAIVATNQTLQSLLTPADIVAIQNGQPVTIYVTPGVPVDRIIVDLNGLLGVTVSQSLRAHEVYKIAPSPIIDVTASNLTICEGATASLVANAVNPSHEIRWYTDLINTSPIGVTASGAAFTTTTLHTDTTFFIASGVVGCPEESVRIPVSIDVIPGPDPSSITVPVLPEYCAIDTVIVQANSTLGDNFDWYLTSQGTTPIVSGQQNGTHTYTIQNDSLVITGLSSADSPFTIYAAVQDTNTGCWSVPGDYLPVTIVIIDELPPTTTSIVQSFCANASATVSDIQINGGTVNWYDAPVGGNLILPNEQLQDSVNYYASTVGAMCESSNRLEILIRINDEPAPITTDPQQYFCVADNATIGNLIITGTGINWYDENGNSLPPTTLLVNGGVYLATTQGLECESSDSLMITVSISDLPAPTAGDTIQLFCEVNAPTIEDIVLNETTIVWYDENGNSIPPGTLLTDSTSYYASMVSPSCESSAQLEIFVVFERTAPPTTQETTQVFCQSSPVVTVADLTVNEPSIVWYDAAVGGNVVAPSTPLINGQTYYAAQLGSNCESENRLAIAVTIHELPAPTTTNSVQNFCVSSVPPTVSDLQVNEANVVWYNANGVILNSSSVLVNGETYYAVLHQGNCHSSDSLAVSVVIESQSLTSLNGTFNNVCFSDTLTYSVPPGMSNYQWIVTGGVVISGGTSLDNTILIVWQNTPTNSLQVSYETANGCLVQTESAIVIQTTVCSDLTIHKAVNNLNPFIGEEITFTITVSNVGNDNFTNIVVDEVIQSGFTYVGYQSTHGTYNSTTGEWTIPQLGANGTATLTITVIVNPTGNYSNVATIVSGDDSNPTNNTSDVIVEPHCLTVYNEISPNGDGVNDYFHVDCIERFPANSVIIYNRYGNIVYSADGYQNDWDGVANVTGVVGKGEPLPTGTYYYLLKIEEKDFESSGWIYIIR